MPFSIGYYLYSTPHASLSHQWPLSCFLPGVATLLWVPMCKRICNIWAYIIWKYYLYRDITIFFISLSVEETPTVCMCFHVFLISSLIGDQLGCLLLESSHAFVFFSWLFRSSGSCWSLRSTWGLFLCRWKAKDPVSFFYIWWSVSQISFVKDAVFSPVCVFNIFVKAQGSAITWAQLHPFYCSIDLRVCSCASTRLLLFTLVLQYNLKSVW